MSVSLQTLILLITTDFHFGMCTNFGNVDCRQSLISACLLTLMTSVLSENFDDISMFANFDDVSYVCKLWWHQHDQCNVVLSANFDCITMVPHFHDTSIPTNFHNISIFYSLWWYNDVCQLVWANLTYLSVTTASSTWATRIFTIHLEERY